MKKIVGPTEDYSELFAFRQQLAPQGKLLTQWRFSQVNECEVKTGDK